MDLCQVHLKNVRVTAYHGIHEEERKAGTNFIVDLTVTYPLKTSIQSLDQTIDYVALYEWVRVEMNKPTSLLETVAEKICFIIHENYPSIVEINITITKLSPPVVNFQGDLGITIIKKYA